MLTKLIKNKTTSYIIAIFCTLLWGTAFPFIKLGYSHFGIMEKDIGAKLIFAGLRFFIAGLIVFFSAWIIQKKPPKLVKSDFKPVFALGIVQISGQYIFSYIGIGFTSGTNTSIITACGSFFTVLAVPFFIKSDKLTLTKAAGCIFGFAGVLMINSGGSLSIDTLFGDIAILISTFYAAAGNIISKKISTKRDPFMITAFQLIIGSCFLLFFGMICGGRLNLTKLYGLLVLIWLALVSAVAFFLWISLLKHHPASKISVFNLLVPVFGTMLSGIMLGESIFKLETLISLVLISIGIVLVNMSVEKRSDNLEN